MNDVTMDSEGTLLEYFAWMLGTWGGAIIAAVVLYFFWTRVLVPGYWALARELYWALRRFIQTTRGTKYSRYNR